MATNAKTRVRPRLAKALRWPNAADRAPNDRGAPTMTSYEGRLELTWTNKHLALLAHEDGSYEWVPPADYRVAEVRLLNDAGAVGDLKARRAANNLLVRGDALNALTS